MYSSAVWDTGNPTVDKIADPQQDTAKRPASDTTGTPIQSASMVVVLPL